MAHFTFMAWLQL